jgi:hypothetical protein
MFKHPFRRTIKRYILHINEHISDESPIPESTYYLVVYLLPPYYSARKSLDHSLNPSL